MKCEDCSEFFATRTDLQKHCNLEHGKTFLCNWCCKSFAESVDEKAALFHLILAHKFHQCNTCDKVFVSSEWLLRHEIGLDKVQGQTLF